jgi:Ca2+-binding RTX toxin-like protein
MSEITGTASDDVIEGTDDDDTIRGLGGNDLLRGRRGHDTLHGGEGDDTLTGHEGDDVLYGGDGFDQLNGNFGNDEAHGGLRGDRIYGHEGEDRLYGDGGDDTIYGGADADTIEGGTGKDRLYGDEGDDDIDGGADNDKLFGGDGNDILRGGDGNDGLNGKADDDTLYGGAGNDSLNGNIGDDTLYGEAGDDRLYGHDGEDRLDGGVGNDFLSGGDGDDHLEGGSGDDRLYGDDGDDRLEGGAGNDYLSGGDGRNSLFGGDGNDYLVGGADTDVMNGGAGDDILKGRGGQAFLDGGEGNDTVIGGDGNDFLSGGLGDDRVIGNAGEDSISGGDGDDTLTGGEGADTLRGGVGSDHLNGNQGNDTLYGQDGDDRLYGHEGRDTIHGDAGDDIVYGGDDADYILGGVGNDRLYGDAGDDRIFGDEGNDKLFGGGGDDELRGNSGNDVLNGQAGNDSLYAAFGSNTLNGQSGNDRLFGGNGDDRLYGHEDDDKLNGDEGADYLDGGDGKDALDGGAGDDFLDGGRGHDSLHGGEGNDIVKGRGGSDVVRGNAGNDTVNGGSGDDFILGGTGNDRLVGEAGSDRFVFEAAFGTDTIIDYDVGVDLLDLSALALEAPEGETDPSSLVNLESTGDNDADTIVTINGDDSNSITLLGVAIADLDPSNFVYVDGYVEDKVPEWSLTSARVGLTTPFSGSIETVSDTDWIAIGTSPGTSYTVRVEGSGEDALLDPVMRVYDASGKIVATNDDGGSGLSASLSFEAGHSSYYIEVTGSDLSPAGTYTVSANLDGSAGALTNDQVADYLQNGFWEDQGEHGAVWELDAVYNRITYDMYDLPWEETRFIRQAMQYWTEVAGIEFIGSNLGADITFTNTEPGAYADFYVRDGFITSAVVNIESAVVQYYGPDLGSEAMLVYIHEIGHALGLGHAGNYNGEGVFGVDNFYTNDSWQTSVMSYFDQYQNTTIDASLASAVTPMMADIIAIQNMYWPATDTRTGDDVYGYNSTTENVIFDATRWENPIAYTIFDNGGVDTLDFSEVSVSQAFDLRPEHFSHTNGLRGNIGIARNTIIENAIGGAAGDTFVGNSADNVMIGNGGNDGFLASGGNDILDGGAGIDMVGFTGSETEYDIRDNNNGNTVVTDLRSGSPDGVTTLIDIEIMKFDVRSASSIATDFDGKPADGRVVSDVLEPDDVPVEGDQEGWIGRLDDPDTVFPLIEDAPVGSLFRMLSDEFSVFQRNGFLVLGDTADSEVGFDALTHRDASPIQREFDVAKFRVLDESGSDEMGGLKDAMVMDPIETEQPTVFDTPEGW